MAKPKDDFDRLPARVRRIISTVRAGQRLCKFIRHKETGESEIVFFFEPGGRRAPPKSSLAAINSGFLKPQNDGLYGEEFSQSWAATKQGTPA